MNSPQQNKLSMYLAVLNVMTKYNAVWAALTGVVNMVTRLEALATAIGEAAGIQGTKLTGIAEGKRRKRVAMVEAAWPVASDLHAWAVQTGDADLEGKSDYELTELLETPQNLIAPLCQNLHDWANTNIAALEPSMGTTPADLTDLQTKISAYKPLVSTPRDAIVARKEVTGDIATDEKTADAILKKELDKTMKKFKVKNHAFFAEYTSARMIIDLGERHEPDSGDTTPPIVPPVS